MKSILDTNGQKECGKILGEQVMQDPGKIRLSTLWMVQLKSIKKNEMRN